MLKKIYQSMLISSCVVMIGMASGCVGLGKSVAKNDCACMAMSEKQEGSIPACAAKIDADSAACANKQVGSFEEPVINKGAVAQEVAKSEKIAVKKEVMEQDVAVIKTDKGKIVFRFFAEDAPMTVENFKKLARQKFYNGLTFHRVVKEPRPFVIQGGCPNGDGTGGPGYTIKAEFNKNPHLEGTVAMARSQDPDSAGSQFYICLAPQPFLDGKYTVFGQVLEGMDVVKAIEKGDVMRTVSIEKRAL